MYLTGIRYGLLENLAFLDDVPTNISIHRALSIHTFVEYRRVHCDTLRLIGVTCSVWIQPKLPQKW